MVNVDGVKKSGRPSRTQSNVPDYNYPLFFSSSNVSGVQIISFYLKGVENYSIWFRSLRMALLGRKGIVDGACTKDKFIIELGNH